MDQKSDRHVHEDPKRRTSSNTQHRNNPLKTLPGSLFSSSSGIEDPHCIKRERRKSKSTSLSGERKRKRYSRSRSRSDSETSSSSASSDELRHRKKKKKTKKTKDRKKEKKKSHKHKKKKHKKNREEKSHTTEALGKSNPKLNLETAESSQKTVKVKPTEAKRFAPMTQEQWEKEQSKIRKEFDEETGRVRLVRGSGEIIESIVSKQQHREINRAATQQDGNYFQMQLNRKLK